MYAVVKTGGKQYRITPGDVVVVERLTANHGDMIELQDVLMMGDEKNTHVGTPVLEKASIKALVVDQNRAEKIIVFKKKRRQNYRRKKGHRQHQTVLRVMEMSGPGGLSAKAEISAKEALEKAARHKPRELKETPVKKVVPKDAPAEKKAAPKKKAAAKPAAEKKAADTSAKTTAKKPAAKKAPAKKPAENKKD